MRTVRGLGILVLLFGVGINAKLPASASRATIDTLPVAPSSSSVTFEPNRGEAPSYVSFIGRAPGYTLFLTGSDMLVAGSPAVPALPNDIPYREWKLRQTIHSLRHPARSANCSIFRLHVTGGRLRPVVSALDHLPGTVNYFKGSNPRRWRTGIPTFGGIQLQDVYPGIDLRFRGNSNGLEYDWIVRTGADPSRITLDVQGAKVRSDGNGLIITGRAGFRIRQGLPVVYQSIDGYQHTVSAAYRIRGSRVSFLLGHYDRHRPLIIDPPIDYITPVGGSKNDQATDVATDGSGNAYLVGVATSVDLPLKNALQPVFGGGTYDAFVTKTDPSGNVLVTSYLGGSGFDAGAGIAVDAQSNVYLTGLTASTNFPSVNAVQPRLGGLADAFVTELNPALNTVVSSTFLGGSDIDAGLRIAVDGSGSIVITGDTSSTNFPISHAFQGAFAGGNTSTNGINTDAFVSKLSAGGKGLVYSTYLGGSGDDDAFGIGVDSAGSVYVTGGTSSTNFPTKNPVQAQNGGGQDAFIARFDAAGSLTFSTYRGGPKTDAGYGITGTTDGTINYVLNTGGNFGPVSTTLLSAVLGQVKTASGTSAKRGTRLAGGLLSPPRQQSQLVTEKDITDLLQELSPGARTDASDMQPVPGHPDKVAITGDSNPKPPVLSEHGFDGAVYGVFLKVNDPTLQVFDMEVCGDWIDPKANPKPVYYGPGLVVKEAPNWSYQHFTDGVTPCLRAYASGDSPQPLSRGIDYLFDVPGNPDPQIGVPPPDIFTVCLTGPPPDHKVIGTVKSASVSPGSSTPEAANCTPAGQLGSKLRVRQSTSGLGTMAWLLAVSIGSGTVQRVSSLYVDGNGNDHATGLAVDSSDRAFVSGFTSSSTLGAQQGATYNAFVAKFHHVSTPATPPSRAPCTVGLALARKSLKVGQKQKVTVTTLAGAQVGMKVTYPNKSTKSTSGTASSSGIFTWSFTQPKSKTTKTNHSATVTAQATCSGQTPVSASKKYSIS